MKTLVLAVGFLVLLRASSGDSTPRRPLAERNQQLPPHGPEPVKTRHPVKRKAEKEDAEPENKRYRADPKPLRRVRRVSFDLSKLAEALDDISD